MKKLVVPESAAHVLHKAHSPAHAIYFALVAVEAGKWYGLVAAVLLLLTIGDALLKPRKPGFHEFDPDREVVEGEP
jgi:hypothetical protein